MSVHGANRLGTNSLLDLVVFGRAAGDYIVAQNLPARAHKPLPKDAADRALARLARIDAADGGESVAEVGADLRKHRCRRTAACSATSSCWPRAWPR